MFNADLAYYLTRDTVKGGFILLSFKSCLPSNSVRSCVIVSVFIVELLSDSIVVLVISFIQFQIIK